MSVAAQMERHLRSRCEVNLELTRSLVVDDTKGAASRRSGEMADSVECDPWADAGTRYETTIRATSDHARFQDEGTGIYGPEGTRIEAHGGGVLAFDWPAAGGVVFFRSVAGSPGTHFFHDAMPARYADALRACWL